MKKAEVVRAKGEDKLAQPAILRWLRIFAYTLAICSLTVAIYYASQIVGGILISFYPVLKHWEADQIGTWLQSSNAAQFILIAIIEATVIGMVYGLLRLRKRTFKFIGLAWPTFKDVLYALSGFGVYVVAYFALLAIIKVVVPGLNIEQEQQIGFEGSRQGLDLALIFMSLVVLPPITEEILVRGFLYTGLRRRLKFVPALLVTSFVFALPHLQPGSGAPLLWVAAIDTFILSVVLVYLREKTGSLGAPILVHMLKNGVAFTVIFLIAK